MEDVEILPNPEFFTYIQKHTVYLNLTIYRSYLMHRKTCDNR